MTVKDNLAAVREKIRQSAVRTGRSEKDVELILVTKNVSPAAILEAYAAGERCFGENRVQELIDKMEKLPRDIHWHFIGHLQTNKVKFLISGVTLIHSIDSVRLVRALAGKAAEGKTRLPVLVQVNTSGEQTKFGVSPEGLPDVLRAVSGEESLDLKGLMTIGPYSDNTSVVRDAFRNLASLRGEWKDKGFPGLSVLSMGMSHDFEIAVEEGANMVRIGTAVFGERKVNRAA